VSITGPWQILDGRGQPLSEGLGDWLAVPPTADCTGTLRYATTFEVTKRSGHRYIFDLGQVGDFAIVHLNGRDLGVRFWAPYAWDVADAFRGGRNELAVDVTNTLVNRYDAKKRRPSGLLGPVQVTEYECAP
jgi:hypothetical protein